MLARHLKSNDNANQAIILYAGDCMSIYHDVIKHEVFPALGCTEPIAVAYAASLAAELFGGEIDSVTVTVDPGVFKNGFAVTVPETGGLKGNIIAAALIEKRSITESRSRSEEG